MEELLAAHPERSLCKAVRVRGQDHIDLADPKLFLPMIFTSPGCDFFFNLNVRLIREFLRDVVGYKHVERGDISEELRVREESYISKDAPY